MAAHARFYKVFDRVEHLEEAERLADWLLANTSPGYANACWGYPFDWASLKMIPIYTPSSVVSTTVGDGLWELYTVTRNKKYLDACESICKFIVEDLNMDDMGTSGVCFSYTPIDDFHVHNANLFCAEFLARVGVELERPEWLALAKRACRYAMSEQRADGAIVYWGAFHNFSHTKLDHYHSGFEIRCLARVAKYTGCAEIHDSYLRYLEFYLKNYLFEDGLPKYAPDKPYPVDIHGAAEGVLMMAMLAGDHPDLLPLAEETLRWTIENMQHQEGWFAYKWEPTQRVDIPHLRWGQAWMLRAFSELFAARKKASGDWGSYEKSSNKAGVKAAIVSETQTTLPEMQSKDCSSNCQNPCGSTACSSEQKAQAPVTQRPVTQRNDAPQIMMPAASGKAYGSKDWAETLFQGADSDPWGHDWRASQLVRYDVADALLSRHIPKSQVQSFLDVGCALGHFTDRLAKMFPQSSALGVDISETAVSKCQQQYPEMSFAVSQLPELAGMQTQYDLISAFEVLLYVEDVDSSLMRFSSLLQSGGYLLISGNLGKPPFTSSAVFRNTIAKHFRVVDEEIRYHRLYYEYEGKVRDVMNQLNELGPNLSQGSREAIANYVNSGVELLGNGDLLEELNTVAKSGGSEEFASHSIILAQKL